MIFMIISTLKGTGDEHHFAHTTTHYLLSVFQILASQYGAMSIVSRWQTIFFGGQLFDDLGGENVF